MAVEPNTNPERSEGEKPAAAPPAAAPKPEPAAARGARSTAKKSAGSSDKKTAKTAASKPKTTSEAPKPAAALETRYSEFVADVQRLQGDIAKECQKLVDQISTEIEKLKNDVENSDPTQVFIKSLTNAVEKADVNAISDSYSTLYKHTAQRQAAASKRLTDIMTGYYEGLGAIMKEAQKNFLSEAGDYSDKVAEALAGKKMTDLTATDKAVAAQAMLIGAYIQSLDGRPG